MRLRVAHYFQIALQTYSLDFINKSLKSFHQEFLIPGIDDAAQDVRKQVRSCFLIYSTIPEFQEQAIKLAKDLRSTGRKQLIAELKEHKVISPRFTSPY